MALSTRTLLLATLTGFSVVLILIYLYSNKDFSSKFVRDRYIILKTKFRLYFANTKKDRYNNSWKNNNRSKIQ